MCFAPLAVLVVVFYVAAFHSNAQITSLKQRGVPVEITVTNCLGLLGGSGSNPAGYSCTGTISVDNHRYDVNVPGDALHAPGSRLKAISVPGDPALVSTVHAVATESASWHAFILPTSLLVVFVLLGGVLIFRRRRRAEHAQLTAVGRAQGRLFQRRRPRRLALSVIGVALAVATAACGSSTAGSPHTAPRVVGPHYEVTVGYVGGKDQILVDGAGWTLYLYLPDQARSDSTCYAVCKVLWPPLLLPAGTSTPLAGPGIRASLLGTTTATRRYPAGDLQGLAAVPLRQ